MGNHEVDRTKVPEEDKAIVQAENRIGKFSDFYYRIISKDAIPWVEEYKQFEKDYYTQNAVAGHSYEQDKLASYHTINIDGQIVHIMSLNSAWVTCTSEEYVWIEREQIMDFNRKVRTSPRAINIVVSHNHFMDIDDRNQQVAICNALTSFVNICFIGHTHQGDDNGIETDEGYTYFNIAPGLNLANVRERMAEFLNGFMIVDYNLSER
jgi:hypothetical protein